MELRITKASAKFDVFHQNSGYNVLCTPILKISSKVNLNNIHKARNDIYVFLRDKSLLAIESFQQKKT